MKGTQWTARQGKRVKWMAMDISFLLSWVTSFWVTMTVEMKTREKSGFAAWHAPHQQDHHRWWICIHWTIVYTLSSISSISTCDWTYTGTCLHFYCCYHGHRECNCSSQVNYSHTFLLLPCHLFNHMQSEASPWTERGKNSFESLSLIRVMQAVSQRCRACLIEKK